MPSIHQQIEQIPVEELRLDPRNPRLPEGADKWSQAKILAHLKETGAIEELAHSLAAEGFFPNEPLTVMADKKLKGYVALEGNRRVATLITLLGLPAAGDETFFDLKLTASERGRLGTIPCLIVDTRSQVDSFIGFRHIGGLKTWSPEAKARWIVDEVEKAGTSNQGNPFLLVGRRVGHNSPTIRQSYIALQVLRVARDQGGVVIDRIVDPRAQRFGVWLRCMNVPEIRKEMGLLLEGGESYAEVKKAITKIRPKAVEEIIGDLAPSDGQPAVLADSRNVTTYGRVLGDKRARSILRSKRDLEVARQLVEDIELAEKVRRETRRLDVLRQEVARVEITEDLIESVEELFVVVRQMRSVTRSSGE